MKRKEADELLKNAPYDDKPSRLNKQLTRAQAVDIIKNGWSETAQNPDDELSELIEKRVLQVCQDRKCPKWKCPACGGEHESHWDRHICIRKHNVRKHNDSKEREE